MSAVLSLLSLIIGIALGEQFPDIDQDTGYLDHRSIITHGPLVPYLVFLLSTGSNRLPLRFFAIGFCLAVAVHLGFDLFPRSWTGFALIYVPEYGRIFALGSGIWIALSTICCLYVTIRLVRNALEGTTLLFGLVAAFVYAVGGEEAMWRPLSALIGAMVAALILVTRRSTPQDSWLETDRGL